MPIDPAIPLGVKPIQIDSPGQTIGGLMQLKGMMTQQLMHQAQLEEAKVRTQGLQAQAQARQRDLADSETFQKALADNGGDWEKTFASTAGKIAPATHINFKNKYAESIKNEAMGTLEQNKARTAQLESIGSGIGAITQLPAEQRQSEYSNWLQRTRADKTLGQMAVALPDQWSDDTAKGLMWQGTATKQIVEAAIKAQEQQRLQRAAEDIHLEKQAQLPGLVAGSNLKQLEEKGQLPTQPKDVATITETGRHNKAVEDQAKLTREQLAAQAAAALKETGRGHDIAIRGQNMTDARAKELAGLARDERADRAVNRPLPVPAEKNLSTKSAEAEHLKALHDSFDDKFAGLPVVGGWETALGEIGGERIGLTTKGQTAWWKEFQTLKNDIRHGKFGSALTATEASEFAKETISESSDPKVVRDYLNRLHAAAEKGLRRTAEAYKASGYSKEAVDQYVTPAAEGGTVNLRAPDGMVRPVPADQVEHFLKLGAKRVP